MALSPPPPPIVADPPPYGPGARVRVVSAGWKRGKVGTVVAVGEPRHIHKRMKDGRELHNRMIEVEFASADVPEMNWPRPEFRNSLRCPMLPEELEEVRL